MEAKAIEERLAKEGPKHWRHKFEVLKGSGVFTPGSSSIGNFGARSARFGLPPEAYKGKRCLDVGAWTGGFTFAMEDLGAEVMAIDVQNPYNTGFALVHEIRRSKAEYVQASIYDLNPDDFGVFDIIWYSGLFYHLKHPILALERLNSICRDGSVLLMQGRGCDSWYLTATLKQGFRCRRSFELSRVT